MQIINYENRHNFLSPSVIELKNKELIYGSKAK